MNLNNKHIDKWYFGDYKGSFSGSRYNELSYFLIFTFLVTVALSTEESLDPVYHSVYIPYIYNLIELYFISDFVGKISNTWSYYNYKIIGLFLSIIGGRQLLDIITLFFLVSSNFSNDSVTVVGLYIAKVLLMIYNSELREIITRVRYIFTANPAKTFFPITLLSIITYIMASLMYLIEKGNDIEHFGSIFRALWFSFVSVTTIGYGDITPLSYTAKMWSITEAMMGVMFLAVMISRVVSLFGSKKKN